MAQANQSRIVRRTRSFLMFCPIFFLGVFSATAPGAQEDGRQVSIGSAVEHALQQSKLTAPGGAPFHLKAHIAASGDPRPEYSADVEEYWVSPEKWRRSESLPSADARSRRWC